jgi:hypothetical protein
MTTERITDDNGDELEHGDPDFPGQFPDPMTREDPVRAALDKYADDLCASGGATRDAVVRTIAREIEARWQDRSRRDVLAEHHGYGRAALAASPADGAGVDVERLELALRKEYESNLGQLDSDDWADIARKVAANYDQQQGE